MAESVEAYIEQSGNWAPALEKLRHIALAAGLTETVKWGLPTYMHQGKQVCGLGAFKQWVAIWFPQGVFLKDPHQVLVTATEGKTKGNRQWRFADVASIHEDQVLAYMLEARQIAESGLAIKVDRNKPVLIPDELQQAFQRDLALAAAFEQLSKSCQREYSEHISEAKRPETRLARLEKCIPAILATKGLHDKYR